MGIGRKTRRPDKVVNKRELVTSRYNGLGAIALDLLKIIRIELRVPEPSTLYNDERLIQGVSA